MTTTEKHTRPDRSLDKTRAALRREIGPPTDRDDNWQPMINAGEVRQLLDALDEHDEREAAGSGWQQPARSPRPPACPHWGRLFAAATIAMHSEGHEWVCPCGAVFVVVSDAGRDKRLVRQ